MGIKMAVIMGGGTYGGVQLDKWLGLKFPLFTIVLAMTSVCVAIYLFIKDFIKK
jgi:hypothetical protein